MIHLSALGTYLNEYSTRLLLELKQLVSAPPPLLGFTYTSWAPRYSFWLSWSPNSKVLIRLDMLHCYKDNKLQMSKIVGPQRPICIFEGHAYKPVLKVHQLVVDLFYVHLTP